MFYFRFGSGFGADARRKRHTADSGYGSEQPLDRRWSQEFGHEVRHILLHLFPVFTNICLGPLKWRNMGFAFWHLKQEKL